MACQSVLCCSGASRLPMDSVFPVPTSTGPATGRLSTVKALDTLTHVAIASSETENELVR